MTWQRWQLQRPTRRGASPRFDVECARHSTKLMTIASCMESSGRVGRSQVTAETSDLVKDRFRGERRGPSWCRGKGPLGRCGTWWGGRRSPTGPGLQRSETQARTTAAPKQMGGTGLSPEASQHHEKGDQSLGCGAARSLRSRHRGDIHHQGLTAGAGDNGDHPRRGRSW